MHSQPSGYATGMMSAKPLTAPQPMGSAFPRPPQAVNVLPQAMRARCTMPPHLVSAMPQAMRAGFPVPPPPTNVTPQMVRPGLPTPPSVNGGAQAMRPVSSLGAAPQRTVPLGGGQAQPLATIPAGLRPTLEVPTSVQQFVAFVTGGNTGIGKEIVRKLASAGVKTVMGCQSMDLGTATVAELRAAGCDVTCTYLELCDPQSIRSALDFIAGKFGRLDILVNNAAICFNDPTLYGRCEYTPFEKQARITVDTNFFGTLDVIRTMLPLLRSSPSPRIVTISSSAGRLSILKSQDKVAAFTAPTLTGAQIEALMRKFVTDVENGVHASEGWGHTCYGMSKLGLIAFTRVLAREEPRIMVNCADPGYCATDMNAKMGYDPPEKGAHMAAFLALLPSDKRVTGTIWYDGAEKQW